MIPIVAFTPLARKMVVKYGKKELSIIGTICSIIGAAGLFIVIPNSKGLDLVLYVVCQLIYSLGLGVYSTVSWAMMGDAIDYNEWKTGNREESISLYQRVIELSPDYSWAYFNLGSIYYEDGFLENAKENLQKTLKLNPKDDGASIILAKIYLKENNNSEALKILKIAILNNPYNGDLNYSISQIYKQENDIDKYKYHLQEAINNSETLTAPVKLLQYELKNYC